MFDQKFEIMGYWRYSSLLSLLSYNKKNESCYIEYIVSFHYYNPEVQ